MKTWGRPDQDRDHGQPFFATRSPGVGTPKALQNKVSVRRRRYITKPRVSAVAQAASATLGNDGQRFLPTLKGLHTGATMEPFRLPLG